MKGISILLLAVFLVCAAGFVHSEEIDVLTGTTVRLSAENSQGHPKAYAWYVFPPGSPEGAKPDSTEETFFLIVDRPGTWEIQLWVFYSHSGPDGTPWVSRKQAFIHARSVVARIAVPTGDIDISDSIDIDGSHSEIAFGVVAGARFLSDGEEIPGCVFSGIGDPALLHCSVDAADLGEGQHLLGLELISGQEESDDEQWITVVNPPPFHVDFSVDPENPDPGEWATFTITVFEGYTIDDLAEIRWWWDDSGTWEDISCPPQFLPDCSRTAHSFELPGFYQVQLEAETTNGATASATHEIIIGDPPQPPHASFSISPSPAIYRENVEFTFTGSCEGECSWSWDFGDQGVSTMENPGHTYLAPGSYEIGLDVVNSTASDSCSNTVDVENCWVPDGGISSEGECYGAPVILTAPTAALYQWSTGEELSSIEVFQPGSYSVDLGLTGSGCWAWLENTVELRACRGIPEGNVDMDPSGSVDAADTAALLRELADGDGEDIQDSWRGDTGAPGADLAGAGGNGPDGNITSVDLETLLGILFTTP